MVISSLSYPGGRDKQAALLATITQGNDTRKNRPVMLTSSLYTSVSKSSDEWPCPDLLQVFSLKLMNLEEKGTETWMELLGTHVAYFLVDFNLTYESNLGHRSVTHLSLRHSVTGAKFLVLLSKLHCFFKKNAKGPSRRVKHRKT